MNFIIQKRNTENLKGQIRLQIIEKCRLIHRVSKKEETGLIHTSNIEGNNTLINYENSEIKTCEITGLDISMQKDCSMMLSEVGIRYYRENYFFLYKKIIEKHLTKRWVNSDFKIQYYHIAHNIRDVKRNRELKQKRLYSDNQLLIFNLLPQKINTSYL